MGRQVAAAPDRAGVRCRDRQRIGRVDFGDLDHALCAERGGTVALGHRAAGGDRVDHRPVVRALDQHGDGGGGAVDAVDREDVVDGLASPQGLHRRAGVVQRVVPQPCRIDGELAVARQRAGLGNESVLAGVAVEHGQLPGGQHRAVLGNGTGRVAGDQRRVVRAGDRDRDRPRLGHRIRRTAVVSNLDTVAQRQGLAGAQEVEIDAGGVVPAVALGVDREAADQGRDLRGIEFVRQIAAAPGHAGRLGVDGQDVGGVGVRELQQAGGGKRRRAVALRQRRGFGDRADDRPVVAALHRDRHHLGQAVGAEDGEAVGQRLALAQGLHRRAGIAELIAPGALGVDAEAPVSRQRARLRLEAALTRIGIGHRQLPDGRDGGVLGHGAGVVPLDRRLVVGPGDGDRHRLLHRRGVGRTTVVTGDDVVAEGQRLALAQEVEVLRGRIGPAGQAAVDREAVLQRLHGLRAELGGQVTAAPHRARVRGTHAQDVGRISIGQPQLARCAQQRIAVALEQRGRAGDGRDDRPVVAAMDGQRHRLRRAVDAEHGGGVGQGLAQAQGLHRRVVVAQRVGPGAERVDAETAVLQGRTGLGAESGLRCVHIRNRQLALRGRRAVLGDGAVHHARDHRRVVGAGDRQRHGPGQRGRVGRAAVVDRGDGVAQRQRLVATQEVQVLKGLELPGILLLGDRQAVEQRLDLGVAQMVAQGAAAPDRRAGLHLEADDITGVGVGELQHPAGGQRGGTVGLGHRPGRCDRDDLRPVVAALDGHGDHGGRVVDSAHREGIGQRLAVAQGLHRRAAVGQGIGPGAIHVDVESAVGTRQPALRPELRLAGILILHRQLASGSDGGILPHHPHDITRHLRLVVRAGDRDLHGARHWVGRALPLHRGGDVIGQHQGLVLAQEVQVNVGGVDPAVLGPVQGEPGHQRVDRHRVEVGRHIAAAPGETGRLHREVHVTVGIGLDEGHAARGGQRGTPVGLGQAALAVDLEYGFVRGSAHSDGDHARGAVERADGEGVGAGVAQAQALHDRAAVLELVGPGAGGADLEVAVDRLVDHGREGRFLEVAVGDGQLASDGRHLVLDGFAGELTGDLGQIVGAGDRDGHRPGHRVGRGRTTVVAGRDEVAQGQRVTLAQEVEVDRGTVGPAGLLRVDLEAVLQRVEVCRIEAGWEITSIPGHAGVLGRDGDDVVDVAVEQRHRALGGQRGGAVALRHGARLGDRIDDRLIVRAVNGDGNGLPGAIDAGGDEGVRQGFTLPQRLHGRMPVVQGVSPSAIGLQLETAVGGVERRQLLDEGLLADIGIGHRQRAAGRKHRLLGDGARHLAADHRAVFGAGDGQGDGARLGDRVVGAAVVGCRQAVAQRDRLARGQKVQVDGRGVGPALLVGIDRETRLQRIDLGWAQVVGQVAAAPLRGLR